MSDIYQLQGSQKSYQNELSPNGYQYNRPISKYSTTPSPQSQTVGFPQPFRPNIGAVSQSFYTTTASPFSDNTNPTTYRETIGSEFPETTSNPFIPGERPEDRITAITSSPFRSRDFLGAGTSTVTSSPLNFYSISPVSSNGDFNYPTSATSSIPNRDFGNYQSSSNLNTIPDTGFDYGSNNQLGISPTTQGPSGFIGENTGNAVAGSQLGQQGYRNFNSSIPVDLGTNSGYGGNDVTFDPINKNEFPTGSYNQRPGPSNTESYNRNSATGLSSSNTYNKSPGSPETTKFSAGNIGQNQENLIPQGTSNFGRGSVSGYGSNIRGGDSQTLNLNSFIAGNTETPETYNAYGGDSGAQKPSNFITDDTSIKGPNAGYDRNAGLIGSYSKGLSNIGSNNAYGGLDNNQISGNSNAVNLDHSGPNYSYGNNFGNREANNAFLGSPTTNIPRTFSSGNGGDNNSFNRNLGQQESNNAIEGSYGSQNPVYTSVGNQGFQNPTNGQEGGVGFSESNKTVGGTNTGTPGNIGPISNATPQPQNTEINDSGSNGDYSAIPGTPDLDYPILSEIPPTKFNCDSQKYPGYYADIDARCQVFHICANGLKYDFLCPNGTVFHQKYFVCVWWNQFECNSAESLYKLNENLYDNDKMGSLIANAAGATGAQGPSVTYAPGFSPVGSASNFNPSTGLPNSPINSTPASDFEGPSINSESSSQINSPSFNSEAFARPQGQSNTSPNGYEEETPNNNFASQQQGSKPNIGSSIALPGSSSGAQSSSGSYTPPPNYERPPDNYNFLGQSQSQLPNLGSPGGPAEQSPDYGAPIEAQGSPNNIGKFASGSTSGSLPSAQGSPPIFGSSPDLQGSSASYPGYQQLGPSAGVGPSSSLQGPPVTYNPHSVTQNSATNFESLAQRQGITDKNRPPSSAQESINYKPSQGFQSYPNNFETSNNSPSSSSNFQQSAGSQPPSQYFKPTSPSQGGYENLPGLSESSTNLGQVGGQNGFTSTNSPSVTPQESTKGYTYVLPSTTQIFSGNVNPSTGVFNSSNNYPQFSSFQKPPPNFGPSPNSQIPFSNYKPLSSQSSGHQSLAGLPVHQQNSGSSYNSPEASANFVVPASSSSSSPNLIPPTSRQGSYADLGQQSSQQKPSSSYGVPSSNFGQQQQPTFSDSNLNFQKPLSSYSSTPNSAGQLTFGQPIASQFTSARFSPLFSQPSSNYGAPSYTSGSTLGSNFDNSQGSSPAPFTLTGAFQESSTTYRTPQSPALDTPRPQSNYSPSVVNRQPSSFGIPASEYSSSSNNEQSLNNPTSLGLSRPFSGDNRDQTSNYSPADHSSTPVTLPDNFSSPFTPLSTAQPESYSTESNVPSNSFGVPESSYPSYSREMTLENSAQFPPSNQQITKPNREYLPPFRKR